MDWKIRELKYRDAKALSGMILKITEKIGNGRLLDAISSQPAEATAGAREPENKQAAYISMGVEILRLLIEFLSDDMEQWFADLCAVPVEEYRENAPFDIQILVVNQLVESPGVDAFFTGALRLSRTINGLSSKCKSTTAQSGRQQAKPTGK